MGCQNAFARHRQAIRDRCILRISLGEQNENEESPQLAGDRGVCSTRSEASQQQTANQLHDLAGKGDALALRQLKALATKGNLEAAFQLSVLYFSGEGVLNDPAQSVTWCRKAAEGGHAEAEANLGTFYTWGRGVAKDLALAAR
jgi:TPR repeat protein